MLHRRWPLGKLATRTLQPRLTSRQGALPEASRQYDCCCCPCCPIAGRTWF